MFRAKAMPPEPRSPTIAVQSFRIGLLQAEPEGRGDPRLVRTRPLPCRKPGKPQSLAIPNLSPLVDSKKTAFLQAVTLAAGAERMNQAGRPGVSTDLCKFNRAAIRTSPRPLTVKHRLRSTGKVNNRTCARTSVWPHGTLAVGVGFTAFCGAGI